MTSPLTFLSGEISDSERKLGTTAITPDSILEKTDDGSNAFNSKPCIRFCFIKYSIVLMVVVCLFLIRNDVNPFTSPNWIVKIPEIKQDIKFIVSLNLYTTVVSFDSYCETCTKRVPRFIICPK